MIFIAGGRRFLKFIFSLDSLNFIIGHKSCQLFSLKWQFHFIYVSRKYQDICIKVTIVCQSFFQMKIVSYEKVASSAGNTNSNRSAFPWDSYHSSVCIRSALCKFYILSHRMLKKHILKNQDLIKLIILMLYWGNFKMKLDFLLCIYGKCMSAKNTTITTSTVLCYCLDSY